MMGLVPLSEEEDRSCFLHVHTLRKGHVSTNEKMAIYKIGGEPSPETESAGT